MTARRETNVLSSQQKDDAYSAETTSQNSTWWHSPVSSLHLPFQIDFDQPIVISLC